MSDLLVILSLFFSLLAILLSYASRCSRLREYNIKLKMKLTDLALKTDNDIYVVYTVSEEDKNKIRELKNQKNKIDAVKLLKKNYQMDLFEAKVYVDYL